jgi:hypothetical protein
MVVREKAGCWLLRQSGGGFFLIVEFPDDEALCDVEARDGTAGIGIRAGYVDR